MIPRNRSDWWMLALASVCVLVVVAFDLQMESRKTTRFTAERVGEASGRVTKHFSKGFVRGLTSKEAATNGEEPR